MGSINNNDNYGLLHRNNRLFEKLQQCLRALAEIQQMPQTATNSISKCISPGVILIKQIQNHGMEALVLHLALTDQ